ncbi:MAG: hypothetical protein ABSA83_01785 [Verrucomicrobiota bacterium]|jgi:hypothetical protein
MQIQSKPIKALCFGTVLLTVLLCRTAQANLLNESGTSILADVNGTTTGPEALTVSWSVVENPSDVYTYTYTVNNPAGDVMLPGSPNPGSPEIVDTFDVTFNASVPGAVLSGPTGGLIAENQGTSGLSWFMSPVVAGTNGGPLSFQSDDAPILGNASATDDDPPSPWTSVNGGQQIPVPMTSIPDAMSTAAPLAGVVLLLAAGLRKRTSLPS